MKINVVAIIPAKEHSNRLPNKNVLNIWGHPMLSWAIKACYESKYKIEPWVSSDSKKILDIAESYGAKTYIRDKELCGEKIYKQAVIRDAAISIAKLKKIDLYISLQPNSPEILGSDLDNAIDLLYKFNRDEIISVDKNLMQNAAFRVFRGDYVFQKDLSTCCGVYICDIMDVNTIEDFELLSKKERKKCVIF